MPLMAESTLRSCFHPRWVSFTLLVAGRVLTLTHVPPQDMPRIQQLRVPDKVEHVVAYSLIAGFFPPLAQGPVHPALLLIGLGLLAVIGALDETTQPLVHRTCDLCDYVRDLTGIAVPCIVLLVAEMLKPCLVLS